MEYVKQDVRTGLQYELQGDYYLIAGENDDAQAPIGIWGQRHLRWLKRNRRVTYTNLLTSGKLTNTCVMSTVRRKISLSC